MAAVWLAGISVIMSWSEFPRGHVGRKKTNVWCFYVFTSKSHRSLSLSPHWEGDQLFVLGLGQSSCLHMKSPERKTLQLCYIMQWHIMQFESGQAERPVFKVTVTDPAADDHIFQIWGTALWDFGYVSAPADDSFLAALSKTQKPGNNKPLVNKLCSSEAYFVCRGVQK